MSAKDLQKNHQLRTQDETVLRKSKNYHYSLELNGLNKRALYDIRIFKLTPPFTIGIKCYSKTRLAQNYDSTDMQLPHACWLQVQQTLLHMASTKLPPANADYREIAGFLRDNRKFNVQNDQNNWHFNISIENYKGPDGNERMVLLDAVDLTKNEKFRFRIPWVHLPVFNHHADLIETQYQTLTSGQNN